MKPIHNRMPVILSPEAASEWLNPALTRPEQLKELLHRQKSESIPMEAYAISTLVNSPRIDQPELIQPQ